MANSGRLILTKTRISDTDGYVDYQISNNPYTNKKTLTLTGTFVNNSDYDVTIIGNEDPSNYQEWAYSIINYTSNSNGTSLYKIATASARKVNAHSTLSLGTVTFDNLDNYIDGNSKLIIGLGFHQLNAPNGTRLCQEYLYPDRASNGHKNINGVWKDGFFWKKISGTWKRCILWKKINGVWKKGI